MLDKLAAEFPRDAVSWRAQSVTKDGSKAMALAYIDARDVMQRLDEVAGAANWQDRYEFHGARTICYLSIRVDGEWITKADGAGDSDVEAEKGAISDALKRAAVKWGIGRYLYALDAPWVPCECGEWNGKKQWKKWTDDPWNFVRGKPAPQPAANSQSETKRVSAAEMKRGLEDIEKDLLDCETVNAVNACAKSWAAIMERDGWSKDYREIARPKFEARREAIRSADAGDAFPGDAPSVNASRVHQPLNA